VIRIDLNVEREYLVLRLADFNPMRSRAEVQTLKDTVEIVDLTCEVAVDIDRCFSRLDLDSESAISRGA